MLILVAGLFTIYCLGISSGFNHESGGFRLLIDVFLGAAIEPFGNISDAVSLLYIERPTAEQLKAMDLFMISEIKKPKDGMLEIKFFDRLKALEKLESKSGADAGVSNLFDAIGQGAKAVSEIEQS